MKTSKLTMKAAITAIAAVAILISIIYVAYLSNKGVEKTVVAQTQQELLTIAKAVATSMEEFFIDHSNALLTVSNNPMLQKGAYEKHRCCKPSCKFCPIINLYEIYKNDVDAITFLDNNGTMLHRSPFIENRIGIDCSDKPGVAYVIKEHKSHVSEVFYNNLGNLVVSILEPIFYKDKFAGIVRWMIETDTIAKRFIEPAKVGKKGFVWMFDNRNIIISHPRKDFIGISVLDAVRKMHREKNKVFDENRTKAHIIKKQYYLNRVKVEGEGTGLVINSGTDDNNIIAYKRVQVGNAGFNLVVTLPYSEIIGPINKHAAEIFGLAGFVIILLSVGGFVLFKNQKERAGLEIKTRYLKQIAIRAEALRESEARLRSIFDAAENVSLIMTDLDDTKAHILEFSRGAEHMFGYNREEIIYKPIAMLHLPEDVLKFPAIINSMRQKKKGFTGESTLIRKSGERFPALFSTYPIFDSEGNMTATLGVSIDITRHKQAKEALRESEEKYRVLFNSTHDAMFVHQPTPGGIVNKFIEVNDVACKRYGYTREEFLQLSPLDLSASERLEDIAARMKKLFAEKYIIYEKVQASKEGKRIPVEISSHVFDLNDQQTVLSVVRDISERMQAEKQIRLLSQQLIKAQEIERQMISRELHDSIAQDLSVIKISFDTIAYNDQEVSDEIKQMFLEYSKTLQNSIMAVRDLAYDLRPPGLNQLGIVRTIFNYCEDFSEKTGLNVDFSSAGMEDLTIDADMKINLYRLVQEGLINIRKHAEARHVNIRLAAVFPNIILRIKDDGKGFDVKSRLISAQDEKRMGLRSMEERVGLLGGIMNFRSSPAKGTSIFIKFSYNDIKDIIDG